MATRDELLRDGLRYDPQRRRQSVRRRPEDKGVWVFLPGVELRAAGINPDAEPPEYAISTSAANPGAVHLRFYR